VGDARRDALVHLEAARYHSILVPLDGSTFSEHALPVAARIARLAGSPLQLVRVIPNNHAEDVVFGLTGLYPWQEGRAYLHRVADLLEIRAGLWPSVRLLGGPVVDNLCEHAVEQGADLVVMTTHGRGPLSRIWLGSVADELVRRLPMPLLLVRPQGKAPDWAAEPLKNVLIALDGGPLAEAVLGPAVELGRLTGASFTLLGAVPPPPAAALDMPAYGAGVVDGTALERVQGEMHAYLEGVARPLREQGLAVRTRVVAEGRPAAAILAEAEAQPCDLIALATHGRRGLSRLFLGSVADKVVRGAAASVLLCRPLAPAREDARAAALGREAPGVTHPAAL
jgi:nucleotide-binding universal stress UspA family protein